MLSLIIYGTKGVESVLKAGRFYCPQCGDERRYQRKQIHRYFTLYFIPLFPVGGAQAEYVECSTCGGTFTKEVLKIDPKAQQAALEEIQAEFTQAMLRVMVDFMMADGEIDNAEVKTMAEVYKSIAGKNLSKRRLNPEIERFKAEGMDGTVAFLEDYASRLNDQGKLAVLRGGLAIAAADNDFAAEEQAMLQEYARALGVSKRELDALVDATLDGA